MAYVVFCCLGPEQIRRYKMGLKLLNWFDC